ncbi:SGNH/GDSL hydrolase family protein [Arthrobacter gengyunqii]|uniref:SGNH/GDSL hydrolase family protein n=1 Tax=Arthrobacter gengyunqii TaxID=2886940 RepID=A0A9X1LZB6_9MICC|nr:SGNH/GDSL hydrolase family protein [Arthrobacter gengyunqii]MCC3268025.1 SGNH/GDSL hydrolase family protein [Arthrobacter gengyunqii]UOY95445.1 SGNH/GDSL hydrolase family protein [Arthrobacter gengyunqii]
MAGSAAKRGLVLACAAALAVSAGATDTSGLQQREQPRSSLLAGYLQQKNSAEAAGGLPRTAWKDISAFQQLRTAEGHPLAQPVSGLSCAAPTACREEFGDEVVLWTAQNGITVLHKSVDVLSRRDGFSSLGKPLNSEYAFGAVYRTDFENGSLIRVPELDRVMTWDAEIAGSAVVIGDSQTGPGTWVDQGLTELGYRTVLRGAGGTGYIRGNGSVGNYYTALTQQQWVLPWGTPQLVVLQGGGNDAGIASDVQIAEAARTMIAEARRTYPKSRLVMIGVISSAKGAVGSRRTAVDALLASVAQQEGVEFLSVGDWWTRFSLGEYRETDGRHFTDAGHRAAGQILSRELGALLSAG